MKAEVGVRTFGYVAYSWFTWEPDGNELSTLVRSLEGQRERERERESEREKCQRETV